MAYTAQEVKKERDTYRIVIAVLAVTTFIGAGCSVYEYKEYVNLAAAYNNTIMAAANKAPTAQTANANQNNLGALSPSAGSNTGGTMSEPTSSGMVNSAGSTSGTYTGSNGMNNVPSTGVSTSEPAATGSTPDNSSTETGSGSTSNNNSTTTGGNSSLH